MRENNPIHNVNHPPTDDNSRIQRILSFLPLLGLALFLFLTLTIRIAPPDLAFYYSFAHSLVYDADFCFANEFARFPFSYHELYLTTLGLPANDWPMGTGVCWIPFLILSLLIRYAAALFGIVTDFYGFGWFDQWVVTYGSTLLYSGGTLWLTWRYCLGEGLSRTSALWSLILMAIGSSYSYHLFINSADSHPPSAFFIVLFLLAWQKNRKTFSWTGLLFTGCSIGMAGLIRPHNLIFLLTPVLDWFLNSEIRKSKTAFITQILLIIAGAFITFFPQILVWKTLYGSWLMVPRSSDVLWTQPELYNTLFSDFHGMISWSPLFGLGLIGLFTKRKWLPSAIPVLILIYIYSCNLAWWCGGSFGNRRMVSCAPLFILGIASLFDTIPKLWLKIVAIVFGLWTLLLLLSEVGGMIQLDHYQSWVEILAMIQKGWLIGLIRLLIGAEWGSHLPSRIIGFLSVLSFLSVGILCARAIQNNRITYTLPITLTLILFFNLYCIAASLRTPLAAKNADLTKYIPRDRFTWIVYYEKGFYLLGKREYFDAVETMMAAVISEPRHPEPWMYLGYVSADIFGWNNLAYHFSHQALIKGKSSEDFFRFFERILTDRIASGVKSPEALYNQRGIIRGALRNFHEAEEDFRKALSINSNFEAASKNLIVLEHRNRGAKESFFWE